MELSISGKVCSQKEVNPTLVREKCGCGFTTCGMSPHLKILWSQRTNEIVVLAIFLEVHGIFSCDSPFLAFGHE
jgi:hypothetical protein